MYMFRARIKEAEARVSRLGHPYIWLSLNVTRSKPINNMFACYMLPTTHHNGKVEVMLKRRLLQLINAVGADTNGRINSLLHKAKGKFVLIHAIKEEDHVWRIVDISRNRYGVNTDNVC